MMLLSNLRLSPPAMKEPGMLPRVLRATAARPGWPSAVRPAAPSPRLAA
jgi:hypothetical protein